jgi:hypothetical protein
MLFAKIILLWLVLGLAIGGEAVDIYIQYTNQNYAAIYATGCNYQVVQLFIQLE